MTEQEVPEQPDAGEVIPDLPDTPVPEETDVPAPAPVVDDNDGDPA